MQICFSPPSLPLPLPPSPPSCCDLMHGNEICTQGETIAYGAVNQLFDELCWRTWLIYSFLKQLSLRLIDCTQAVVQLTLVYIFPCMRSLASWHAVLLGRSQKCDQMFFKEKLPNHIKSQNISKEWKNCIGIKIPIFWTIFFSISSFTFKLRNVGNCLPRWVAQPLPLFVPYAADHGRVSAIGVCEESCE